jgi:hypothetical protein
MARLTDPDILARYKQALAEWAVSGAIELEGRAPVGLRATLEGMSSDNFKEALYLHVCEKNGEVDQVKEEREPWREHWEWHYDVRLTINGRNIYVETRLYPESFSHRMEPTIRVVQIKLA